MNPDPRPTGCEEGFVNIFPESSTGRCHAAQGQPGEGGDLSEKCPAEYFHFYQ